MTNIPCLLSNTEAEDVRKGKHGVGSRKEKITKKGQKGFSEKVFLEEVGVIHLGRSSC